MGGRGWALIDVLSVLGINQRTQQSYSLLSPPFILKK